MKKEKRYIYFILVMVMMLVFSGCGTSNDSQPLDSSNETKTTNESETSSSQEKDSDEGVDLKIWLAGSGDAQSDKTYRDIFDSWIAENSPNSTYELTFVPWTEYFSKISTALVSGEGPDLFMSGYGQIGSLYSQGSILDVTEYVPQDWDGYSDIPSNILDAGSVEGKLYGILEANTRVFLYRKDIAEANGVTEEDLNIQSLEDLENLVQKMSVYDGDDLVVAGLDVMTASTGSGSPEQYFYFTAANIDEDIKLWDSNYQATFNNETGVKAMEYLRDLYDKGYCFQSDPSDITQGIISGLSAMTLAPESVYGIAEAAYPGNIGVVPAKMNSLLIGNFIVVNKTTEHPKEAADLLTYMFSTESSKKKAEGLGMYTLRQSLDDWYVETLPELTNVVEYYKNSKAFSDTLNPTYNQQINVFRQTYEKIMETDIDISEALSNGETEWNNIIE